MKEKLEEAIRVAAGKAADSNSADDALKFTQAALNAAHALATLDNFKKLRSPPQPGRETLGCTTTNSAASGPLSNDNKKERTPAVC